MNARKIPLAVAGLTMLAVVLIAAILATREAGDAWSQEELMELRSLWIGNLETPADPSNAYLADARAAELGRSFFFDTRFSSNGQVACATCHQPERNFTDGLALARGVGETDRKSMSVVGIADDDWFFWDGRVDSLWAQALGPLESPVEHGFDRTSVARLVATEYRAEYEEVFGPLPDMTGLAPAGPISGTELEAAWNALSAQQRDDVTRVFVNVGKAIAAFESRLAPGASRFDRYVEAELAGDRELASEILTKDEIAGARLFIGSGQCTNCHSGPTLSNGDFHNTGVPIGNGRPVDPGRAEGAPAVVRSEFNCLSSYSDAKPAQCLELRFLKSEGRELERAFKVPSLRNVGESAPYMHAGQFETISEALEHYNRAPESPAGHSELQPLALSARQLEQLEAFLLTLSAPIEYDGEVWPGTQATAGAAR